MSPENPYGRVRSKDLLSKALPVHVGLHLKKHTTNCFSARRKVKRKNSVPRRGKQMLHFTPLFESSTSRKEKTRHDGIQAAINFRLIVNYRPLNGHLPPLLSALVCFREPGGDEYSPTPRAGNVILTVEANRGIRRTQEKKMCKTASLFLRGSRGMSWGKDQRP